VALACFEKAFSPWRALCLDDMSAMVTMLTLQHGVGCDDLYKPTRDTVIKS